MYASSDSGVLLQDVVHYISSTSISRSEDVLRLEYISSVVLYTVKNILPFGEGKFTKVKTSLQSWQRCTNYLTTLEFLINEGLRLLIFGKFSSPYALIKDPTFI